MPQQDACTLLDQDHQRVEQLFSQYLSARDPAQKEDLCRTICMELTVHTQVEEEVFYPAFLKATGEQKLDQEARHEHQEARELIAQLESHPNDDEVMRQLQQAVLHHVQDERQKMFPKARQARGLDLQGMVMQLQERKGALMQQYQREHA